MAASDFVYRDGSILHPTTRGQAFVAGLTALLIAVLPMGLLHRQERGPAKIGWETSLIIVLFLGGYRVLYSLG